MKTSRLSTPPLTQLPRTRRHRISLLNANKVDELLHYASERDPELGHFPHIATSTGARRGEICAIRWSDLDTKGKTLTIEHSIAGVFGGIREKSSKTEAGRRLALDADTLCVFEAQRAIVTDRARQVAMKIAPSAYVFSREPDCLIPMTPGTITSQFQAVRDTLGYHSVRLHDLRHLGLLKL